MAGPAQQLVLHRLCLLLAAIAVRAGSSGQAVQGLVQGALGQLQARP